MSDKYGTITFQCFTQEQVKEINKKIKENIFQEEKLSYAAASASKKGDFFHVQCLSLLELIHPWLYQCQLTNREVFGYDIFWDFHLEVLNYNVYGENGEYNWHIDADPRGMQDIKLTCLLNLSEETYEGGEFYTITDNKKIEFTSGMGLILTSLIAHKVSPVTKGERISLTYGAYGPLWR
jgi:hypothetical protein